MTHSSPTDVPILIVDDDIQARKMLALYLNGLKYQTIEANDGVEALTQAISRRPQAILLDLYMPRMDGFTFIQQLRERGLMTPIIMLTAAGELDAKIEAFRIGADDFLCKPYQLQELEARLKAQLNRQQQSLAYGIQGQISEIDLTEMLQIIENSRRSGRLVIQRGITQGTIVLREGRVSDAVCDDVQGLPAIGRLLAFKEGGFAFRNEPPEMIPLGLDTPISKVLMDWAQATDEAARDGFILTDDRVSDTDFSTLVQDGATSLLVEDDSPLEQPAATDPREELLARLAELEHAMPAVPTGATSRMQRMKFLVVASRPEVWHECVRDMARLLDPGQVLTSEFFEDVRLGNGFLCVQVKSRFLLHLAGATLDQRLLQFWSSATRDIAGVALLIDDVSPTVRSLAFNLLAEGLWNTPYVAFWREPDAAEAAKWKFPEAGPLEVGKPDVLLSRLIDLAATSRS